MTPDRARAQMIIDRLQLVETLLAAIRDLSGADFEQFSANPHLSAAAESYLRRSLEALLDVGRHILAKAYGRAVTGYKTIADALGEVGVLTKAEAQCLRVLASYRNRMVHFYDEVTSKELYQVCAQGLDDIEAVMTAYARWMREHPERVDDSL